MPHGEQRAASATTFYLPAHVLLRHLVNVVTYSKDEANMSPFQPYVGKAPVFYVVRMALATISAYAETQLVR